jgi:transcriptional regulator with XRE-family HTH domain
MNFGKRILSLLKENEMSQAELARQLGATRGCVSHWIAGKTRPRHRKMERMARLFGLSLGELIDGGRHRS